jgi:hypothetical protein
MPTQHVGTWVGSMMTHLWVYDGWVDKAGRTLTLESDGSNFVDPSAPLVKHRDAIEIKDRDCRLFSSVLAG